MRHVQQSFLLVDTRINEFCVRFPGDLDPSSKRSRVAGNKLTIQPTKDLSCRWAINTRRCKAGQNEATAVIG